MSGTTSLEFELESSDALVLVVSEKVRTSKWVHNEVSMAEEIGILVIPLLAQKIRSPLWLRHLQQLDFCVNQHWEVLIDAIGVQVKLPLAQFGRGGRGVRVKPEWATDSGADPYGEYADFEYKKVVQRLRQRLRLIKAGTFWMGTKVSEGGLGNDGNHHQVTLSKDFLLADTACTQALWQAVTGDNPASFKDDTRPVENVSWDDVQQFLHTLNGENQNLSVCLPTEAQWEYACRA